MPKSSPIFLDANSCQFLSRLCWSWILNPKGSSDTVNKVDMFEEHVFVQQHFNQQSNCETRYKIKCIFISNLKLIFGSIIVLMHFLRRLQNKKIMQNSDQFLNVPNFYERQRKYYCRFYCKICFLFDSGKYREMWKYWTSCVCKSAFSTVCNLVMKDSEEQGLLTQGIVKIG